MKNVVIILHSQGARGAFEAGVWQAIRKYGFEIGGTNIKDIQPLAVFGVSSGAINGALIAESKTKELADLWNGIATNSMTTANFLQLINYRTSLELEAFGKYPLSEIMALQHLGFQFDLSKKESLFEWTQNYNPFTKAVEFASKLDELEDIHFLIISSNPDQQLEAFLRANQLLIDELRNGGVTPSQTVPTLKPFTTHIIEPTAALSSSSNFARSMVLNSYLNGYLLVKH
ncbi:MAG: hypothetical protein A3D31_11265 [Candidatus Fluviicola riflensis]|nr:MAG: hypothetical protein CHH17_15690 [Candidatus Fluviicola riflensis]OGS77568.1 MAG: hypothetical protein A3D31_11265 [Candidatus Fluviicola riflensis]OGS84149.1 MAG: hypothetical protein A3E30_12665 [Fluviicola sp. RIFCSPHIGHO2_12_FULL_43_24]OGS84634.1 MAG: hypothetical protein A2724_08200 [Fluviicola sp. RIFCSPHIGHO2_01_FULL_43_53]